MNWRILIKKMLPGLIPLFIFIIADELWGTAIGLIVAIGTGIAESIYFWVTEKRLDTFILFDTLLIVAMGIISLTLDNAIFFKLKPSIIESILAVILGISVWSDKNYLLAMSRHYLKGIETNEVQKEAMRKILKYLFWIVVAHTALVTYAAFMLSKEAWAFISGGLFYIVFGLFLAGILLKNRLKKKPVFHEDILPIIDTKGVIKGHAHRSEFHKGGNNKLLHPVVHLHLVSPEKKILLQKRAENKLVQPGKWDTAVGGHVAYGEKIETALFREAKEEIGIEEFTPKVLTNYLWESDLEKELVFVFSIVT
ncbi:MAG: septation protein IspZ, partial [Bacteroidales bacterium]|nr:septation protein IspZ [Bacteroidales bacterium]